MAGKRRNKRNEFKPDAQPSVILKSLRLTKLQQMRLLRWAGYVGAILGALIFQDVIMSQIRIFGATTELCAAVILLITILEGVETGSLFVLIASTLYFYSGSSPGAYCIGLLTFLGVIASLFRQMYWRRSRSAIVFCAALAQIGYSLGLYGVCLFNGLTRWDRLPQFLVGAALNILVMIPLYPLIHRIGMIGGNVWKE